MPDQCIVLIKASGAIEAQVFAPPGQTAAASGSNPLALREVVAARIGDLMLEKFDAETGTWSADMEKLRATLLTKVDEDREAQRRPVMTQLFGQDFVYGEKSREVYDYRNIIGNLLATLTTGQRRSRFPFAMAEMDATGDTIAVVMDRFEAGALASRAQVARIDGLAMKAKAAIRAASTETALRAAAAVAWKTTTS